MIKAIIGIILVLAVIYIGLGALLYVFQRSQQYFPSGSIALPPTLSGLDVSHVEIAVPDGERIAAWYRPAPEGAPTFLYFPGNGGSIADSHDHFLKIIESGFGFLAISYRGYPGSSGSPSETGLYLDGLTSYDWLTKQSVSADSIIIYGWSLGSGIAAKVASERPAEALVLEAPFLSAEAIARYRFPIFPVGLLMKDPYRTDLLLSAITQPLVVLHGTDDATIPVDHGREIVQRYTGAKELHIVPGGSHTDLWDRGGWEKITGALKALGALH